MDRRTFLRRAALVGAGVVAADQLDLLERLTWRRSLFPGWQGETVPLTSESLDELMRVIYSEPLYADVVHESEIVNGLFSAHKAINVRGVVKVAPGTVGHRIMLDRPITMMAGDRFSTTYEMTV